jgi:hypothetical protein
MIDFRYHVVSLISVFLALAVGIVLGAGPLNEPIARGLTQSVKQLQADRDATNAQLKTAQAAVTNRDTFITQVEPGLVADRLGGRSVVVVTLPGFDPDAVKPLTTAVAAAGAKVTGRVGWGERVGRHAVADALGRFDDADPAPGGPAAGSRARDGRAVREPEDGYDRAGPAGRALPRGADRGHR